MTVQTFGSIPTETVLPTLDDAGFQDWTPTFTGFSVDPLGQFRYVTIGEVVIVIITMTTAGTSNATFFTMTMPFANAFPGEVRGSIPNFLDSSSTGGSGMCVLPQSSDVLELYTGPSTATDDWGNTGDKRARFTFIYERVFASPSYAHV